MIQSVVLSGLGLALIGSIARADAPFKPQTVVGIQGEHFTINGALTYSDIPTCPPEKHGMLFNVRAVNSTFDDLDNALPEGFLDDPGDRAANNFAGYGPWDPQANTERFIAALPSWREKGVLAVTLNFQGGCSCSRHREQDMVLAAGNQTPNNNPFGPNAEEIHPDYLARMGSVIEALDRLGMVAILGIFYFGQDQRIDGADDGAAVVRAVDLVVDWLLERNYRNVLIEISNEADIPEYVHVALYPTEIHKLIERVQQRGVYDDGTRLLASASSTGLQLPPDNWMEVADFYLPHGNGLNARQVRDVVFMHRGHPAWRAKPRPICFNEDSTNIENFNAAAGEGASWGLYNDNHHQSVWPANWTIWSDENKAFFGRVAELVGLDGEQAE